MSDPFSRLSSLGGSGPSPDLDAIRLRAHRIRRRRQTGLAGAGAAAMAIIAVVGVLLATGPGGEKATTSFADSVEATTKPRALGVSVATPAADAESKSSESTAGTTTSGGAAVAGAPAPVTAERSAGDSASLSAPSSGGQAASKAMPPLEATLEIADQMVGRGKTFTLEVCNRTSGTITRDFGTSQRYDFEVSRGGDVVWRWSDGQFFTQVVGSETWKASECKEWSAEWDGSRSDGGRAPAGDYKAVGVLKTSPEMRTSAVPFSLSAL